MNEPRALPHQLILTDRSTLTLTGVSDVDTFDDTAVIVHTAFGVLSIKGRDLQIRQFNVESGDLNVDGQIDLLEYTATEKGGRFARWFR